MAFGNHVFYEAGLTPNARPFWAARGRQEGPKNGKLDDNHHGTDRRI
jgi:hypothetical protein